MSINPSTGLYTADEAIGSYTVRASAGGISGTASVEVVSGVVVPTYATLNPADKDATVTLSNGNLTQTGGAPGSVRATQGLSSGKWYWEVTIDVENVTFIGAGGAAASTAQYPGVTTPSVAWWGAAQLLYFDGGAGGFGAACAAGDIIGVALDMDSGKIWFSKNGVWQGSGNPATGANPAVTGRTGTYYPMNGANNAPSQTTSNFGATGLAYAPPTGFNAGVYA